MSLTAKVATIGRVPTLEGDGTIGSGKGHPQRFRSQGDGEPLFQQGAGQVKHLAVAEYDFDKDGALTFHATAGNGSGVFVPANAIVTHSFIHVLTVPVGPTAMAVSLLNDQDLVTEAAISGAPWSTLGAVVTGGVEPGTESGYVKVGTTPKEIAFTATVANTSAGKFVVFVEYVMSTVA